MYIYKHTTPNSRTHVYLQAYHMNEEVSDVPGIGSRYLHYFGDKLKLSKV